MTPKQREIQRKRRVIEYAEQIGNVRKACRYYGVARSTFYLWRARYRELGDEGLMHRRCVAHNHPNKTPAEVVGKILHLRRTYHMGPLRIVWYLERYHGLKTSDATVYRVCRRHGLRRLPHRVGRRAVHTHRYEKRAPGHHVQVDVKFLTLQRKKGAPLRRYQYTAIDDATRIRALKVYLRHTQANAIDFIDYVVKKFPFRIRTIRTDRGHEFQALFHCLFSPERIFYFFLVCFLHRFGQCHQSFGGVRAAVEKNVFYSLQQFCGNFFIHGNLPGVYNSHIHSCFDGVVEKCRMHCFPHGIITPERE